MTIEEKRKQLDEYCDNMSWCNDCRLNGFSVECIFENFSNECVEEAYDIAFGSEDKATYDTAPDTVQREEINHPDRYAGGKFECIDIMLDVFGADAVKHFCILNAFKYIWRAEKKNGVEDIKKTVWYLNKYIDLAESEGKDESI